MTTSLVCTVALHEALVPTDYRTGPRFGQQLADRRNSALFSQRAANDRKQRKVLP